MKHSHLDQHQATGLLLTRQELRELTGFSMPSKMTAWLESRAWVFEPPCKSGEVPKVDRTYYLARMSGQTPAPRRSGPKLDWMFGRK